MVAVGVLALQGDVFEHLTALRGCDVAAREVRTPTELEAVDALVIPGGESTTVGKLLDRFEMLEPLRRRVRDGMPTYGTCTGMILLARDLEDGLPGQAVLGAMDIGVRRNAFGRQRESFEAALVFGDDPRPLPAVFIRAPEVVRVGDAVTVLARWEGRVVAVRQGSLLATAFHPELTGDDRVHRYFVEMARAARRDPAEAGAARV